MRKDLSADLAKLSNIAKRYERPLRNFNYESYYRMRDDVNRKFSSIDRVAEKVRRNARIERVVKNQSEILRSLGESIYERPIAIEAIRKHWETLDLISRSVETPEIRRLQESLLNYDFSALQTFADSLKSTQIEAPNLALLKSASLLNGVRLPRGLPSVIRELHTDSAQHLARSEDLSFDCRTKTFYIESQPNNRATISETNIICSSLYILSGLDETELIIFLDYLEEHPNFAIEHPTGKRICEIVSSWSPIMNFDQDCYYHARSLPEGKYSYTMSEMKQAPIGMTWHGRYNYVGQSHYYFSDKKKGAIIEVQKHSNDTRIQIVSLQPIKDIRMIDLSEEIKGRNIFLEHCRFSPDLNNNIKVKREYLLPCFLANCCKRYGIEGIKYYGSKEYKNYVSWRDSYFNIVGSEIELLHNG